MPSSLARAVVGLAGCALVGACSGGPKLPSLTTASLAPAPGDSNYVEVGSVEAYSRIARGANRCWFGGAGRLRLTHILYADADSQQKGGAVEIVVHERSTDQPKPWGFKAYRIAVSETSGRSLVSVENLRMPEIEIGRMRSEVMRWAAGGEACEVEPVVPEPPVAATKAAAAKKAR